MSWLIAAGIWLACGYLGAGWWYGYWAGAHPRDFWVGFLLGPICLLPMLVTPRWRRLGRLYPWQSTRWRR